MILLLVAGISAGSLTGQISSYLLSDGNHRVAQIGGSWDLNADGQPEWLVILAPVDSLAGPVAVYLEASNDATFSEVWRYAPAAPATFTITGGAVAYLDAGRPSLVLVMRHSALAEDNSPDWLVTFSWNPASGTFADEPSASWNYRGQGVSYLRPFELAVADMDDDGDDELLISTGSPDRMILIADWDGESFVPRNTFLPGGSSTGPTPFTTVPVDLNGDLRIDILAVGGGERPALRAYMNTRQGYIEHSLPLDAGGPFVPSATATGDLNGDGQDEVVLVDPAGKLTLVSMAGPRLSAQSLDAQIANLQDLALFDADGDSAAEMVYLLTDGSITSSDPNLRVAASSANLDSGTSFSSLLLVPPTTGSSGQIIYAFNGPAGAGLVRANMGDPLPMPIVVAQPVAPEEPVIAATGPPAAEPEAKVEAEEPAQRLEIMIAQQGSEVYFPDQPVKPDPRALPPNRTPDHVIHVGEEFVRDIIGDRIKQFASFRFLTKAPDMVFNFQRQSIVWVPALKHLGAWNVAYEIVYHLSLKPEQMITDSVLMPEKDIITGQLLIYVNDPPHITTQPTSTRLLAGHLFAYRLGIDDRNSDARIDYRLEAAPPGMAIDPGGIISWRTDATHHDDYQVVISISDGFDRDVQTFSLNVNAQLTITSPPFGSGRTGQPYRNKLEVFQPGTAKQHSFSLLQAPQGMAIDAQGVVTWTPRDTQIDTQRYSVRVTDGTAEATQEVVVYVNAAPRLTLLPPRVVSFMSGDTLRIQFEGTDDNSDAALAWSLAQGPLNMSIDSTGLITWPTSYQDLDAKGYVVNLSDGIDATTFRGVVFANSPIGIISLPPDTAIIGQPYLYQVQVRDENAGTVLKYRRPVIIRDISRTAAFEVTIQDDKIAQELPRYLADFRNARNIFINKPQRPEAGQAAQAARIDLKQAVKQLFIEEDRLVVVITDPAQGLVELEDVLWELFQGARGIMPRYTADPVPLVNHILKEFPDGMTISHDGRITWQPTPSQAGSHAVRLQVSDGFTRAEQIFEVYANYPPVIVSQPDTLALIGKQYVYHVQVDEKNADAELTFRLVKAPAGMRVDSRGMITWSPSPEQLNWHEFILEVTDGHSRDRQAATIYANMVPRVISQPKPVALNSYEYNYRLVAEDLNRDEFRFRAIKIPRFSEFDEKTGRFRWRPRGVQKGPNDIAFEIIDSRGGVTIHEFQVHVFDDPSRRQFLFTSWPLMLAFVGIIFVLGITVGG